MLLDEDEVGSEETDCGIDDPDGAWVEYRAAPPRENSEASRPDSSSGMRSVERDKGEGEGCHAQRNRGNGT